MIEAESSLLETWAKTVELAEDVKAFHLKAGSPKDTLLLCEVNLLEAQAGFAHVLTKVLA